MILIPIIASIAALVLIYRIRQSSENKKYQNIAYLSNLQKITEFIDTIDTLNEYITWVEREKIKSKYFEVRKYFKNKTKFYKKEEKVKKFNEIYGNFDNYIVGYNKNYVRIHKEILKQYFDDIEERNLTTSNELQ
jgi:DNA helicase-4